MNTRNLLLLSAITMASTISSSAASLGPATISSGAARLDNGSVVTLGQPFVGLVGTPGSGVTSNLGILPAISASTNAVSPPSCPTILPGFHFADGRFQFSLPTVAGRNYVVEASTNLSNWTPIWTNLGTGGEVYFSDPEAAHHPNRFYRVTTQ